MARRIVFAGKQKLNVETFFPPSSLSEGQVRLRGLCSLISTGTENIVLNGLYDPGTHWDAWAQFPFYPGYSFVGCVVACGPGVTRVRVGQRVAAHVEHATEHVVSQDQCHIVPDAISDEQAAWHSLAKIAYAGAKAARYALGQSVLIIGAGPIGQLSARWALAAGAGPVAIVDPQAERLPFATRAGVHATIAKDLSDGRKEILDAFGGAAPDIVVDTTGAAAVFPQALNICARFGKVVLLGDSGTPNKQCLTPALLTQGLHVIGVHGSHVMASEALSVLWPLVSVGRFSLDGLVTHRFPIGQAEQAYTTANDRRGQTLGILFTLAD